MSLQMIGMGFVMVEIKIARSLWKFWNRRLQES